MNDSPAGTSYDEVPYDSYPFPQAHPARHAAIATLLGLSPPRVAQSRILELGCASGGHLLPLAEAFPEARFVGIDLSERQIRDGQANVQEARLSNVELRHASILDVEADCGTFDYIICHGVFSWVSAEVREKILSICNDHLSPAGVAYISYNVYPGWRMRQMLRDMMCYHAGRFPQPEKRVEQAQALLDFLAHAVADKAGPYGILLKREVDRLSRKPASYLLHEFLEDENVPLYFHEFVAQAGKYKLQYLAEARLPAMNLWNHPPAVQDTMRRIASNIVEQEQYLDFVCNRAFRETLICHREIPIQHQLLPGRLKSLWIAAPFRPPAVVDFDSNEPVEFSLGTGNSVTTRNRVAKAAYALLGESWPANVEVSELARQAARLLVGGREPNPAELADAESVLSVRLLKLAMRCESLYLSTEPVQRVRHASKAPAVTPLARCESRRYGWCTNGLHEACELTGKERALIALLDGSRDMEELRQVESQADALLRNLASQGLLVS